MFWTALLACAAPFSMVFLGSSSVFSTILHPPYAKSMHHSCIGKFHVCFDLHFWLVLLHFPCFFLGPPVCFLQFCLPICKKYAPVLYWKLHVCFDLHFWLVLLHFPCFVWVLQFVFYNFASPICKKYAPVLYWKLQVWCDLHFWLVLLHFPCFVWVLQCVFYNFASPICKKYAPVLYWKVPCMFWSSLLACAAPFSMVFLGSSSVFSTILPPPYARSMHQSCIGSSKYGVIFTFGLCCSIFHVLFGSSSVFSTILHGPALIFA